MKVFNINPAMASINFKSNNTPKNNSKNENDTPAYTKVSSHKLNSAMKAAVLVPLAAGLLAACEKTEFEQGGEINTPLHVDSTYIHRFPEVTINGVTFAEQTAVIKNLDTDSKLNRSLNNMISTLGIPKKTDGAFPVNMYWAKGDSVYNMIIDKCSTDEQYIYNLTEINKKAGSAEVYKLKFSNGDDRLNLDVSSIDKTDKYSFVNKSDSINVFTNNGESEKVATLKKEIISMPDGNDKHSVEMTTYNTDTTRVNLDNFLLWCVNNEKK